MKHLFAIWFRDYSTFLFFIFLITGLLLLFKFSLGQQMKAKQWSAPEKFKTIKSTVNINDAVIISRGKELYNTHCKICHGAMGNGDGPKSASLKTTPGNLNTLSFNVQTDGEIYYKLTTGRDEMPGFEKKIPLINDQWAIVAFIRTFKK